MQFEKFVAKAYFLPLDVRVYVLIMTCCKKNRIQHGQHIGKVSNF